MNQLTMSTISFKLSTYLFILFLPIFFFRTFSADISLRDFLIMFVVLFFCITWQKHILKKYKSDGGILNATKSKTSIPATILLALCLQFIVLKIVMNICIFINIFVMNNLWLINYNVHKIMLVIIAVFLLVGYFILRHGYKHYSILSKAAMFITIALMLVAIFTTLPTLFIKSYESLEVISTFDETMTLAVQLFSIFGVWLLVASIVTYDEKRKKIGIVYNIVNFLLVLVFLTFLFNKLIGHVPYGENTFVAMFFLVAQTIYYILLFKQLLEKALHLKIIRSNKKTKFDRIIIFSVLITLMAIIFSNLTIEETFVTCISMMFLIIIIFQLFAMRNLKKVHYIILNIITVAIYLTLLAYVMNIYIILVSIITVFCVYYARNKNIESIQIIQKEFHIHDKNGNELRFNYQNHNLFTYHDNLKTINNTDDINKILNSIGINEFEVIVENKSEEITDVNETTLKNIYYITTKLAKPKINIENLNIKQIDQPIEYFWEHKNVKEFGV